MANVLAWMARITYQLADWIHPDPLPDYKLTGSDGTRIVMTAEEMAVANVTPRFEHPDGDSDEYVVYVESVIAEVQAFEP